MLLWSLIAVAEASPCPDVHAQIAVAWSAYEEAELEKAKGLLSEAYGALACQREVVSPQVLLDLYRLDALVSLTQDDRKGAVYATIRAVNVDPTDADPPAEYGPELAELYGLWSTRLAETTVTVSVTDGGSAWIDGRKVEASAPLRVVQGEHLVQLQAAVGVMSEVRELAVDTALTTGIGAPVAPAPLSPLSVSTPAPAPTASPAPTLLELVPHAEEAPKRRHPVGLLVAGGVSGALGGAGLVYAFLEEQAFLEDPYTGTYGGCAPGDACWAQSRTSAIDGDAQRIRIGYLGGYGLTGLGVGLLGLGAVGFPVRTDGRTVGIALPW